MLISCNMLKKYFSSDTTIDWLGIWDIFTISSAEVEGIEEKGKDISGVIIAKVVDIARKVPDAKLNILTLDIGDDKIKIVTSAQNAYIGMVTACCPANGLINGNRIEKLSILGVESEGVCVSERDLGISQNHTNMLDLPKDYMIGSDIKKYIELEDIIVEIDNKSLTNRPDLWGHYGIAREISAITGWKIKDISLPDFENITVQKEYLVANINDVAVNRYTAIKVSSIHQNLMDLNMKLLMSYCGYECNTLAELVSTYVTLEYGLPIVIVKDDGINNITINMYSENDKGDELNSDNLVVYANGRPMEVAGVCVLNDFIANEDCESILIEVANYDAATIRKSSISIHNRNEKSIRHEKSLDPELTLISLYRCLQLLRIIDPSVYISSNLVDIYCNKQKERVIVLTKKKLSGYLGFEMDDSMVIKILKSLNMEARVNSDSYVITVPTYRATKDIEQDVDVIEEIARIYGYDNFYPQPLDLRLDTMLHTTSEYSVEYKVKEVLAMKYNLHEVHTYLWYDDEFLRSIGIDKSNCEIVVSKTSNCYIRDELGLSVLSSTISNARKRTRFGVFEIGTVYNANSPRKQLCIILCDSLKKIADTYQEVKNIVYGLVNVTTNEKTKFLKASANYSYIDNNTALNVYANEVCIGQIGIVVPSIINKYNKTAGIVIANIDFENYLKIDVLCRDYQKPSKYPMVSLDYTISMNRNKDYQELDRWLSKYSSPLIKSYKLIDTYDSGEKRKFTIRVTIAHDDRTLQSEEIRRFSEEIVSYIKNHFEVET